MKGIGFRQYLEQDFKTERPDSNWFLEQWILSDISNMSTLNNEDIDNSIDFKNGRSGDWRRAPLKIGLFIIQTTMIIKKSGTAEGGLVEL